MDLGSPETALDVALVGGHRTCLSEPRFVDLNNAISDDVLSRLDLEALHERYVRQDERRSACSGRARHGRDV